MTIIDADSSIGRQNDHPQLCPHSDLSSIKPFNGVVEERSPCDGSSFASNEVKSANPKDYKFTQSARFQKRMASPEFAIDQAAILFEIDPSLTEDVCAEQEGSSSNMIYGQLQHQGVNEQFEDSFSSSSCSLKQSQPMTNFEDRHSLLLKISVAILLIALVLSELLSLGTACVLYFFFLMIRSDYGRRALKTLPRDIKGLILLIQIKLDIGRALKANLPLHAHFLRKVKEHPNKVCLIEIATGHSLTFVQFNCHSNKYANLFKSLNFRKDDVMALFMENGIEFFAAWFGLSKIGVITAWINSNLKMEPLAHSINVSKCKSILTTPTLAPMLRAAVQNGLLSKGLTIYLAVNGRIVEEAEGREHTLENSDEPKAPKSLNFQSVLCYIYTSGTTGHPKAAIIKHYRYFLIGCASGHAFGIRADDRLYIMMPMYHSAGGILGASQVLIKGCSAVIRHKFSAKNFWKDCVDYNCTVSQYIGEICRYLLAQPPSDEEYTHPVRLMFGNGLRPQIWDQFVRRFGIQKIGELYGSTEGNSNLVNIDNHTGSCGFMPIYTFLHSLYPIRLLKVDKEGGLVRDANGFCVQCKPGDTGEVVGTIRDDDPILRFEGYVNQDDTSKKIIKNCLRPGDTVFTSGDILHWDRLGYLYFKDRRGDTYRWRGENVSTMEVEGVIQPLQCIGDATVYGVQIPGREGRAGMIGVSLAHGTQIEDFIGQISTRLVDQLASYAIPVFLRICDKVDRTGTFKLKKAHLQQDGYDLEKCSGNRVYYWDSDVSKYVLLTKEMKRAIDTGDYSRI